MPLGIHPGFLVVLLILVLIIFGPGKLPELGGAVGRTFREFRKESDKIVSEIKDVGAEHSNTVSTSTAVDPKPETEKTA
ncbi:MAG: twin-arginine translocase TatA/TatE family subunit [Candidatus Dormibacteraeota bacterium]|nr:twin-arginine translocase TatA/TatE family subunit [Candidatus Dormibacteraeota bacterium]